MEWITIRMENGQRTKIQNITFLVTCAFGMGASCLSLSNYASGAFVYPLSHEFGWSRRDILLGYSVITFVTLFSSQVIGYLADRLAPKRIVVPGQIAFGLGFVALGLFANESLSRFYALHLLLAIMGAGSLPMTFNRIVANSFTKNRGLALGVIATGSGFCGLIIPPYLTLLIEQFGWRGAYVGLGLVPICGAILLSLPFLPKGAPVQAAARVVKGASQGGLTLGQALRGYRLWMIGLSLAIGGGVSTGVVANLMPLLRDQGVDALAAASVLSVFGLAVIAGRVGVGALIDRFWAPPVAMAVMVPAAGALLVLATLPVHVPVAYGCAILMGLAAGAEVDMLWFLGARYFGLAHVGRIYALLYVFFTIGIGLAAPTFGAVFDQFGSYKPALFASAAAWMVCGGVLFTLGPYPDFDAVPDAPEEVAVARAEDQPDGDLAANPS